MDGWLWALVIVGGPILLGLFLFLYGDLGRKLTRSERKVSEEAAHENWGKEKIR